MPDLKQTIADLFLSRKAQGGTKNAMREQEAKDAAARKAAEDAAKEKADREAAEKKVKEIQFADGGAIQGRGPMVSPGAKSPVANGGLSGPSGMLDFRNQMATKGMKNGGAVKSRGDGIAQRGKTKGRMI